MPRRAGARVRDGDLEAVGREPAGVIEVLVAVAAAPTRTLYHHTASREVADNPVGARARWCGILTHVRDVPPIGRDENILVGPPHIIGNATGLNPIEI